MALENLALQQQLAICWALAFSVLRARQQALHSQARATISMADVMELIRLSVAHRSPVSGNAEQKDVARPGRGLALPALAQRALPAAGSSADKATVDLPLPAQLSLKSLELRRSARLGSNR